MQAEVAVLFGMTGRGVTDWEKLEEVRSAILSVPGARVNGFVAPLRKDIDFHVYGWVARARPECGPVIAPIMSELKQVVEAVGVTVVDCDPDITDDEL